jgi:Ras-related protein Rab-18
MVTYEEGATLAAKHRSPFCEASAKTRQNVRKPFIEIVDQIVKSPQLLESTTSRRLSQNIVVGGTTPSSLPCAC